MGAAGVRFPIALPIVHGPVTLATAAGNPDTGGADQKAVTPVSQTAGKMKRARPSGTRATRALNRGEKAAIAKHTTAASKKKNLILMSIIW
ncbi:MAG TPA: hypothetical protein VHG90_01800 [Acidimicrobiales bacterium]|nr:hypothetical protein [Acidimicrobiales bacterium]